MKPYVIVTPNYAHVCAGIKVLHRLCHALNEKGQRAYVTGVPAGPDHPGYCKARHISAMSPAERKEAQYEGIVVYPDIVPGNPLMFNNTVRWWVGIVQPSPEHETVFSYASNQNSATVAPNNLLLWHIEDYFNDPHTDLRGRTCYRIHKGGWIPRIPETQVPSCIEITGSNPPTRPLLAKLFQESSIFYSYDDLSTLSIEARLCGCPVKIIDYTCIDRERLLASPWSNFAQAVPGEEVDLPKLRSELPAFMENYEKLKVQSNQELDRFIDITQNLNKPYVHNPLHEQAPQSWIPISSFDMRS